MLSIQSKYTKVKFNITTNISYLFLNSNNYSTYMAIHITYRFYKTKKKY